MGKYTRYSYGFPTIWSQWMYPPKNVSTLQYLTAAAKGIFKAHEGTLKGNWIMLPVTCICLFGMYKISKNGANSEFSVSLRSEKGNWLYGPPSQKALAEHKEHHILHAPNQ